VTAASTATAQPLDGVTIVDLTRYLPGPYCTRLLADLGAHVIKIEPPHGDPMRGVAWPGAYDFLNGGKEIVTLDLRDARGREQLHVLLARAMVCVEGFRPATAREIGVDGATLATRYPDLVRCSISGYGQAGPDADRAAHDLNYQADAGLLGLVSPGRVPGLLIADITAAFHATIAILAALAARRGATLDVSLVDAARAWVPLVPPPVLRGDFACYNVYETSDGGHVALGALEARFWERFCRHVARPEWASQQFAPGSARTRLIDDVRALFRTRSAAQWLAELVPVDCCASAVDRPSPEDE
jgi:crotonobetainyl-CoA:carnitine CoA-transferase CaiB-like acyl-CoA transferase